MLPSQLTAASFSSYPPLARAAALRSLALLQQLPLVLAALLLREMGGYDWHFPAERRTLDDQLDWLASLSSAERGRLTAGFAQLSLGADLSAQDWVRNPQPFLDALTAQLWATHQIDGFHRTAEQYTSAWRAAVPEPSPVMPRLSIVVFGKGLSSPGYSLFRKLRPHGVFFGQVDATGAWSAIASTVSARAAAHPQPYLHWYIDGGQPQRVPGAQIARVAWAEIDPIRTAALRRIHEVVESGHGDPEQLRTRLAETTPADLGLSSTGSDEVLTRFKVNVLTDGSGTQIFSTTFAQWTAREALRRAQPCTLLLRYGARQRQLPMNELLAGAQTSNQVDPAGSLMDADMGAYYTWINQRRLTGSDAAAFLAWSEEHNQAVAIGPALPRGTSAVGQLTMKQLLAQVS